MDKFDKFDLLNDLEENCEYSAASLKNMDTIDLIDAKLRYEGFIGYTEDIISWVAPYFQENPASNDYDNKLLESIRIVKDYIAEQRQKGVSAKEIKETLHQLAKTI